MTIELKNAVRDELRKIGNHILNLADQPDLDVDDAVGIDQSEYLIDYKKPASLRRLASLEYASRRNRVRHFPNGLFGEPAWDILLDLFIAALADRDVSVKAACLAADVPEATAYRWIDVLIGAGLVAKVRDVTDKRRSWLSLTSIGHQAMSGYFGRQGSRRMEARAKTSSPFSAR